MGVGVAPGAYGRGAVAVGMVGVGGAGGYGGVGAWWWHPRGGRHGGSAILGFFVRMRGGKDFIFGTIMCEKKKMDKQTSNQFV